MDKDKLKSLLKNKKRRTKELKVLINGEEVVLKFQAISATELDELRAKHPPTTKQVANGFGVNSDTFNPALVAATLVEPELDEDEARELFSSDYWSTGELSIIYGTASDVCLEGLDIPRNASA